MSSLRMTLPLSSRLLLTLALGAFCLAPEANAQEGERRERAEQGRDRPDQENEEIRTVRRRLRVMRFAVDAFLEAERHDAAHLVELAMHTRELAIEGVRNEKSAEVAKTAPNRGQLAELLGAASNLCEKWGQPDRSHALAELAEVYGQQWRRQKRAEDEGRTSEREGEREGGREQEGRRGEGLDSLERRVHIIGIARAAFDRAGRERNEQAMANAVRYGKMALEGSNEEAMAKAAEAVPSKPNLIELLLAAHNLLAEEGEMERAVGCHQLAEYYTRQVRAERGEGERERDSDREHGGEHEHEGEGEHDGERAHDGEREHEGEREREGRGGIEDLNHRIEILRLAHGALAEAGKKDWAQKMEQFIHVANLQREGADGETLGQAFEGLSMGMTIELLQMSTGLYREWGMKERASACNQLAEFYAARERGQSEGGERERAQANERERAQANERERGQANERERRQANERERAQANERERRQANEREQERGRRRNSLEDHGQRVEILRLVRAAWRESENERAAKQMDRVMHLAELQIEGASGEAIEEAAEGINQAMIIELVQGAHNLYKKWGNQERAAATRRLAEFYRNRAEGGEGNERERAQANERERAQANERERGQANERERAQARERERGQANERERAQAREREQARERKQNEKREQGAKNEPAGGVKELRQQVKRLQKELADLKAALRKLSGK